MRTPPRPRSCGSSGTGRPSGAGRAGTPRRPTCRSPSTGSRWRATWPPVSRTSTSTRSSPARGGGPAPPPSWSGVPGPRSTRTWSSGRTATTRASPPPTIRETVPGWSVWTHPTPGGESAATVSARLDRVVEKAREHPGRTLVFGHGHALRALTARWLGLPVEAGGTSASTPRRCRCSGGSGSRRCCCAGTLDAPTSRRHRGPMLVAVCPRCPRPVTRDDGVWACRDHGPVAPLWRPAEASYDAFVAHLERAAGFPTLLPWPLGPGWHVSGFGVVGEEGSGAHATVTVCSGTSAARRPGRRAGGDRGAGHRGRRPGGAAGLGDARRRRPGPAARPGPRRAGLGADVAGLHERRAGTRRPARAGPLRPGRRDVGAVVVVGDPAGLGDAPAPRRVDPAGRLGAGARRWWRSRSAVPTPAGEPAAIRAGAPAVPDCPRAHRPPHAFLGQRRHRPAGRAGAPCARGGPRRRRHHRPRHRRELGRGRARGLRGRHLPGPRDGDQHPAGARERAPARLPPRPDVPAAGPGPAGHPRRPQRPGAGDLSPGCRPSGCRSPSTTYAAGPATPPRPDARTSPTR